MYLVDTNICIYAIKKKNDFLLDQIRKHRQFGLYVSVLTIAELEFGISNSRYPERNRLSLLEFLTIFETLLFDDHDAITYGKIKTALRREGKVIGPIDTLLAAQALTKDLVMVTNNVKEFDRIDGLRIEDWSSPNA